MPKHYINSDSGHPIKFKINEEAQAMLIDCVINHWNSLIETKEYAARDEVFESALWFQEVLDLYDYLEEKRSAEEIPYFASCEYAARMFVDGWLHIQRVLEKAREEYDAIIHEKRPLSKDQIHARFQDYLFGIERTFHNVSYAFQIEEALGRTHIGGKKTTLEEDYANDPEKLALLACYKDWIAQDMIKREFPLWLHDQLMTIGFNVIWENQNGLSGFEK